MLKKLGITLIILGLLIIITYSIYNRVINLKALNEAKNYIEETSKVINNDLNDIEEKQEEDNNTNYTAVLEIPKIGLKRGVVDATENFNSINYDISVDKTSNYPDSNGNFIVYSHSGNSSIAYFKKLYKVNVNDLVYVYYNGIKYEYEIYKKYDIPKTGRAKVISSKKNKYITLITCNQGRKGYQIVLIGKIKNSEEY